MTTVPFCCLSWSPYNLYSIFIRQTSFMAFLSFICVSQLHLLMLLYAASKWYQKTIIINDICSAHNQFCVFSSNFFFILLLKFFYIYIKIAYTYEWWYVAKGTEKTEFSIVCRLKFCYLKAKTKIVAQLLSFFFLKNFIICLHHDDQNIAHQNYKCINMILFVEEFVLVFHVNRELECLNICVSVNQIGMCSIHFYIDFFIFYIFMMFFNSFFF